MIINNQKNNKTVHILTLIIVILVILLGMTNWSRIVLGWHELSWMFNPSSNPETVEKLLKEKIQVKVQSIINRDPEAINRVQNISRKLTVFFREGTSIKTISEINDILIATHKIENIIYVSKEDALKIYKEMNKDDPLLTDLVTADILPASLEILVKDTKNIPDIIYLLQRYENNIEE
ncbi:MAG: permease-like cell division protein FtsX, partial [Patescibacteria group bacterium]